MPGSVKTMKFSSCCRKKVDVSCCFESILNTITSAHFYHHIVELGDNDSEFLRSRKVESICLLAIYYQLNDKIVAIFGSLGYI